MGLAVLARRSGALCAALALGFLGLLWAPPGANADLDFCPPGTGAGQCGTPTSQRGLAVDHASGRLYVADEANNRVNVFEVDGDFLFAFGFGVADGTTNAFQTCTATCFKGIAGEGAGQFNQPSSIAVDSPSHAIYVGEAANRRAQKFEPEPTGEFVEFVWTIGKKVDKTDNSDLCAKAEGHTCGKGESSSEAGGFRDSPFLAVGPSGVIYAVDNIRIFPSDEVKQRLQRFEPSGGPIPPPVILFEGHLEFALAIAVDATGNLWVSGERNSRLRKYCPPSFSLCAGPFPVIDERPRVLFARGLAIDAAGDVYAAQIEGGDNGALFNMITAFDPASGDIARRFAYTSLTGDNALAAHTSALGEFFSSRSSNGIAYIFQPPPGPVVAPPSLEVEELGSAKATLVAEVNPEGKATNVHFEYLTQAEYEAQENSFTGPATKSTEPKSLGDTGFNLKASEALAGCPDPASEAGETESKCLIPETTYRWQVVAENSDGEGNSPIEGPPFTTEPSPLLGEIWATRVGTDTARLNGEANPNGIPATGWFEYVDEATFQKSGFAEASKAPDVDEGETPLDFGASEGFVTRQVTIYPLDPGTTYRYRLVADNGLIEPLAGEAEELRTFAVVAPPPCPNDVSRIGPGAFLSDCRAYEMVSPLEKAGGDIRVGQTNESTLAVREQAATGEAKLLYGSTRSFGDAVSAPFTSQYIARRIEGVEWETHSINPPRGAPILRALNQLDTEFEAFDANLCQAWFISRAEPPLAAGALPGWSNLYRREDELCEEDDKVGYEALAPFQAPESVFPPTEYFVRLRGVSTDGTHALFVSPGSIPPLGSGKVLRLYEHVRGEGLRPVCVLPGGETVSGGCTPGSGISADAGNQIGVVSDNGQRIFW